MALLNFAGLSFQIKDKKMFSNVLNVSILGLGRDRRICVIFDSKRDLTMVTLP